MSWVGWRCQRCRHEFKKNQCFCPQCGYTVYDPIQAGERPDWAVQQTGDEAATTTGPTFHTVGWAPSAIKDAVEHATAAFKAAEGGYARVSSFELSALIDATRALIEHNDGADAEQSEVKRLTAEVERLKARRGELAQQLHDETTTSHGLTETAGALIRRLTNSETEVEAIRGALRDVGEDAVPASVTTLAAVQWLIGEHAALASQTEELGAEVSALATERDVLSWLHAEAMWHANHHRAQAETQGLSHALLLRGFHGYADQVDAMARKIQEQDGQLALAQDLLGSIWLYVDWRYVSRQMTTEQKEFWADAIDESGDPAERGPKAERWWRDTAPAPAHDEVLDRLRAAMRQGPPGAATETAVVEVALDDDVPEHIRRDRAAAAALRAEYGFTPRLRSCVEAWSDCETGEYHPSCCRFPKSCSATVYDAATVKPEDLEDRRG